MKSAVFCLFLFLACRSVLAESGKTFLSISKDFPQRLKVFLTGTGQKTEETSRLLFVLSRDLQYSGYFTVTTRDFQPPGASNSRKLQAKAYDLFCLLHESGPRISVSVQETAGWETLFQKDYGRHEKAYRLAHQICDDLVLALTGRPGIACSRVCFIGNVKGIRQVYVVDYDGENLTPVTETPENKTCPRWFRSGSDITCLVGTPSGEKPLRLTLPEKRAQFLSEVCAAGPLVANPVYQELVGVFCHQGNVELYRFDLASQLLQRLTFSRFIETSPCFSPDGEEIVFVSDRTGQAQLYVMNRTGANVRPLYLSSSNCFSPDWSPDGTILCFVLESSGKKNLGLFDFATRSVQVKPTSGEVESPSWAPDSRHLVFTSKQSGKSKLVVLNIISGESRLLVPESLGPFGAAWSR
ncbi:MAG TPA: hypothetical protein PK644_04455 [bacterium]|nr:hypothetical protein [bacterium]